MEIQDPVGGQLKFKDAEEVELIRRIEDDYDHAKESHRTRISRWQDYYKRWINRVSPPPAGEEHRSNYQVNLIQEQTLTKLARELEALLGEDAEVRAEAVGPSDYRTVLMVSRFMQWRVFNSMKIVPALTVFDFRRILFGKSFAYAPWVRDTYEVEGKEEVWYEGPGFFPVAPDDLIIPPCTSAQTIHDFPYVIRRFRVTPAELLRGEAAGRYQRIKKRIRDIRSFVDQGERDGDSDEIRDEQDQAEGVLYDSSLTGRGRGTLEAWEWYSSIEDEKTGKERQVVIRLLPQARMLIGAHDLKQLYPKKRHPRPFVEGTFIRDGSYWSMGFGKMLVDMEDEMSVNHQLFTEAGQFSVGPVVFARPATGFTQKTTKITPATINWTEDPTGVNQLKMAFDPQYPILKDQMIRGQVERTTGQTDQNVGRGIDRPTAPRTATGQIALLEEGNIRASLDVRMLREDMELMLAHFWELETDLGREEEFFRVTEEQARGLFEVRAGGAVLTSKERAGRYDFKLKFASSRFQREARKADAVNVYTLSLQNPLIAMNPRALWNITNEVYRLHGFDNFAELVPRPPDLGLPKSPKEEWTLLLQGELERVEVNPADDDQLHMVEHLKQIEDARRYSASNRDEPAIQALLDHIMEHRTQMRQKMLMQALVKGLAQQLETNTTETGGLNVNTPTPLSIIDLQNQLGQITGQESPMGGAGANGKTGRPVPAG